MVVRRGLTFAKRTFNACWIAVGQVKANSQHSAKRRTVAKSCRAFSKGKHWVPLSPLRFEIKTLDLKTTERSPANSGRPTPITLTKPSTEFAIGRAAAARLLVKQSAASQRARSQKRSWQRCMRISK